MEVLPWIIFGFLSGSVPFSLLVGRWARGIDIRSVGDQNPGAFNVFQSAGVGWGIAALVLDWLKGAIPVGLAFFAAGISGGRLVPIALAPVLGHAFSPWLAGRGGKALTVTFGIWTGLTLATGPIILGLLFAIHYVVWTVSGWAVTISMLLFGGFLWVYYGSARPELIGIWLANLLLLLWKHRTDLHQALAVRPSLLRRLRFRSQER